MLLLDEGAVNLGFWVDYQQYLVLGSDDFMGRKAANDDRNTLKV